MKANQLKRLLISLFVSTVSQLTAHQTEADRQLLVDLRAKADKGDVESQTELGVAFHLGKFGLAKNGEEAVRWYRKAAEQNYSGAQFNLGYCYFNGEGVEKNEAEAVKWYRRAADQNFAEAKFELGACYATGKGAPQDMVEAVQWYRKAAEQNSPRAQFNLGDCYENGCGV